MKRLPKPFFILAPMDDVTDTVFRQVVAQCAPPDLFFTEFVNVDGLQSVGRLKLLHKLKLAAQEGPVIAQLWGLKPENFYKTAKEIADGTLAAEAGASAGLNFAGIDLNMGCPAKTVIKNGACAALINNWELAGAIIDATKSGANGTLPVSVKTRVGFNEVNMDWIDYLLGKMLNMLSIHGRTARQMSKVPANWDLIGKAREARDALAPETLIVGNGDVETREQGVELTKKYKLDGIMAGRGIFHDPFLFAQQSPWENYSKMQKVELFTKHIELYLQTYKGSERKFEPLRKFCKVYLNGFDGASELRAQFMETTTPEEALALLNNDKVVL
jgi:tRNA-dihydrouridine synthase